MCLDSLSVDRSCEQSALDPASPNLSECHMYLYAKEGKIGQAAISGASVLLDILPIGAIAKGIKGKVGSLVKFQGKEVVKLEKALLDLGADAAVSTMKEGIQSLGKGDLARAVKESGLSPLGARSVQDIAKQ